LESEKRDLEIVAAKSHWQEVNPPVLTGASGIPHRFNFVFKDGPDSLVFDIFDSDQKNRDLNGIDVMNTYIKTHDIGASAFIICPPEKTTEEARRFAAEYRPHGIEIIPHDRIVSRFSKKAIRPSQ
jgi:hypothetical protein